MFEILTVLETTSVYRLKKAWALLSPSDLVKKEELKALFSSKASFSAFRLFLKSTTMQPPCMPYMGIYLKDIVYLHQMPNYVSQGIVNVTKMASLAAKLMEIHSYQMTPYHFGSNYDVIKVLQSKPMYPTEDEQYKASTNLEPIAKKSTV
jgi:hypothetical protein